MNSFDLAFKKFPQLDTDRLNLIEIQQNHLSDLFKIFGDKQVTKYYNITHFKRVKDGQKYIDWFKSNFIEKQGIRWGISLKGDTKVIGTIGFNNFTSNHGATIGYDLQANHWNKGYISEALITVIDFGFNILNIEKIEAEVMIGNEISERVLTKFAFKKETMLKEWMYWGDKQYDMIIYSLLNPKILT